MTRPAPRGQTRSLPGFVSVIIPARNAEDTLGEQLAALARQTYSSSWEVIVADNGSRDGTQVVAHRWSDRLPGLQVIDAGDRSGSAHARNVGADAATGDFFCFCDADDVVSDEWIDGLVESATHYDLVTGPLEIEKLNDEWALRTRAPRTGVSPATDLVFAPSGNFGIWTDVFGNLGGFREDYPKTHDVEFGVRAMEAGFSLGWAAEAVVHYRYQSNYRGFIRQAFLAGVAMAQLHKDHPEHSPNECRSVPAALRSWAWVLTRFIYVASSSRRMFWIRRAVGDLGRLVGSVKYRILCL